MTTTIDSNDLDDAMAFATALARDCGLMMREGLHYHNLLDKSDGTVLTDIDVAVNRHILAAIAARYADHQVLAEEQSTELRDLDRLTWVVDPIDGTFLYSAGIGAATVSLALVQAGRPLLAVVYDPWTDATYCAHRDRATTRNSLMVSGSSRHELTGARVAVEGPFAMHQAVRATGARVMGIGASVRTGASVADGGLDALVVAHSSPWDVAAAMLLVPQAGGVVFPSDVHAARRTPPMVFAGNEILATALSMSLLET